MRIPEAPPGVDSLIQELSASPAELSKVFSVGIQADYGGRYYHWDKVKYLQPEEGLSPKQLWLGIKVARKALYRPIPHVDKEGAKFVYAEPGIVRRLLHEIDIHGGGELKASAQVANPHTRDTYLINSLIEEAITSSQLEGAATTKKVAREMIRLRRKPADKSEQMIMNNFYAMEFIRDVSEQELSPELIFELHRIVTKDTLENPEAEGRLRESDDVLIEDARDNSIIHIPPPAAELEARLESLCSFANESDDTVFYHPVIKAIILHFLLAYDHPFEDGNGRTARALFYWSMLRQGYWTIEFVSISAILKTAPVKYTRSCLYTETDDNDLTYFIVYQLEVINRAIQALLEHLKKKAAEINTIEQRLRSSSLNLLLNHRQLALINRAVKKPDSVFYIESHRRSHNVTYQTARMDLLKLEEMGLLNKSKISNAFVFRPAHDLMEKINNYK